MYHWSLAMKEGPKNWSLVIFVLTSTFVFYMYLILCPHDSKTDNELLEENLEAIKTENLRLHQEIIRLQNIIEKQKNTG